MFLAPLLPVVIAFAFGIAIQPHSHVSLRETVFWLMICVLYSGILHRYRRSWPALVVAWLGFALAGMSLHALEQVPPPENHLGSLARHGELNIAQPLKLTGWLRSPSHARPGLFVFDLAVESVEQQGRKLASHGIVRVYYYPRNANEEPLRLPYGLRVTLNAGNLRTPRNYGNPGMFDYAGSLQRRGVSHTALLRDRHTDLIVHAGTGGRMVEAVVLRVREALLESIEQLAPSQQVPQSILKAMLLGDDSWLTRSTEEAFQNSGTYHVLVISGWNVAVFAGPLLWLLTRARMANWLSSLLVSLAVIGFALVAHWELPIVRASTMFLIYLAARLFFRHRALTNSLAAAALLLLVNHPSDLFDWGFQLSFLAVLTLSAIALPAVEWKITPLRRALEGLFEVSRDARLSPGQIQFRTDLRTVFSFLTAPTGKLTEIPTPAHNGFRWCAVSVLVLAEALLFTALMQIGFSLVSAHYFHRLTWSGVLGNLLILPFASCIVLLGMVAAPVQILFPLLGKLLGPPLAWLCLGLEGIARFSAEIHFLNLRVPTPSLAFTGVFLGLSVALAALVTIRSRYTSVAGAGLLLACVTLSLPWRGQVCRGGELEMTALDVGQGDALFICFPGGSTMLVDAGGTIPIAGSPVRRQDIGETVVSPYLWKRGVTSLDYVVLSHHHFDHMGGLEAIFENFRVGEFWMGPDAGNRKMEWLRRKARGAGATVRWPVHASGSGENRTIDGVQVDVLSPPAGWTPARVSNNDSIVLRLTYGRRSLLLAGDIESRIEQALAADHPNLRSEVLKVAHHGSRSSSTSDFLARVSPMISIVSVGAFRRFGHPSPEVLERLGQNHQHLYLTPRDGAVTIRTDGNKLHVDTFRNATPGWPAN